jgi:hypothetical protein
MSDRYLRHTPSGILYIWQAEYAQRADFEEVADAPVEENPTPVQAVMPRQKVKVAKPKAIEVVEPEIELDDSALRADASRGLP